MHAYAPHDREDGFDGGRTDAPVRLLLVDDRPENLTALEAILWPLGEELDRAGSGLAALRMLLENDYAAILLDVEMPGMDGFETAQMIQEHPRLQKIPILFLTAHGHLRDFASRGYQAGGVDYLVKPLEPTAIRAKVRKFAALHRQQRAVMDANRELASRASHDLLTGAMSRAGMEQALRREQARAWRTSMPLCAALFDLEDFRRVNADFGHAAGDRVLQGTARALMQCFREMDIVARIGADQFVALLPETDLVGAIGAAERVVEQIEQSVVLPSDQRLHCTGGVVELCHLDASLADLVDDLDDLVCHARESGSTVGIGRVGGEGSRADVSGLEIESRIVFDLDSGERLGFALGGRMNGAPLARPALELEVAVLRALVRRALTGPQTWLDVSPRLLIAGVDDVLQTLAVASDTQWSIRIPAYQLSAHPERFQRPIQRLIDAGHSVVLRDDSTQRGGLDAVAWFAPTVVQLSTADPDHFEQLARMVRAVGCEVIATDIDDEHALSVARSHNVRTGQGTFLEALE